MISNQRIEVYENSGVFLMGRYKGGDGSLITQASISSIAIKVYDDGDPTAAVDELALTVADVVFDALQTDERWQEDSSGYNFGYALPAESLPDGQKNYNVEVKFTPASGEAFYDVFYLHTNTIHSE